MYKILKFAIKIIEMNLRRIRKFNLFLPKPLKFEYFKSFQDLE